MVDSKPNKAELEWRPPEPDAAPDPVDELLKNYDFTALHDRIMSALDIKPDSPVARKNDFSAARDSKLKIQ